MLGLDEVHVLGGERERFPVEATFEEEGAACVFGTLSLPLLRRFYYNTRYAAYSKTEFIEYFFDCRT